MLQTKKINAPKIIFLSFLGAIIIGAVLLSLPIATNSKGSMPIIDALFTSASAVCVTGLIVVDTGTYFSHFGQLVIMILMQIGGLGIMTFSVFFFAILGKRLGMKDLYVVEGSVGKEGSFSIKTLVIYILLITFITEFLGAAILFWRFTLYGHYNFLKAIYHAVFHSISAFCNAGFSLYQDNLAGFRGDWIIPFTVSILAVLGGLGFVVLLNLNTYKFWKRDKTEKGSMRFQTKMVLAMTLFLLLIAFVFLFIVEKHESMSGMLLKDRIVCSWFHAVVPRTAGFNLVNIADMSFASLFLTLFLMFIGGSPGSAAGGIKTTTFMVLCANAKSIIKGDKDVFLFNRTIPRRVIQESICILGVAMSLVFIFSMALLITEGFNWEFEQGEGFISIIYEVISAFSNVGLSTGLTPNLSNLGKLIITITMLIGRISPLTMAVVVGRRSEGPSIRYPIESVMVG